MRAVRRFAPISPTSMAASMPRIARYAGVCSQGMWRFSRTRVGSGQCRNSTRTGGSAPTAAWGWSCVMGSAAEEGAEAVLVEDGDGGVGGLLEQ